MLAYGLHANVVFGAVSDRYFSDVSSLKMGSVACLHHASLLYRLPGSPMYCAHGTSSGPHGETSLRLGGPSTMRWIFPLGFSVKTRCACGRATSRRRRTDTSPYWPPRTKSTRNAFEELFIRVSNEFVMKLFRTTSFIVAKTPGEPKMCATRASISATRQNSKTIANAARSLRKRDLICRAAWN